MNKDDHLEQHLELCKHIYLRMRADGSWPWWDDPDSTDPDGVVESEDNDRDA